MLTVKPYQMVEMGAGPGVPAAWGWSLEMVPGDRLSAHTCRAEVRFPAAPRPPPHPFHYLGAPTLAAHTPQPQGRRAVQGLDLLMVPDPGERIKKDLGSDTHGPRAGQ